tara:strand:+ start:76 stop:669 length:594 start_codon:yes stop_codon:yes gene_type:complete
MFDVLKVDNPGILRGTLPTNIYNSLMNEIREIKINGSPNIHNDSLAGLMEEEYVLKKSTSSLIPFLTEMSTEYVKIFNLKISQLNVSDIWVNLQKKNEYNPAHKHNGILSFVIWMEIPYKILDEFNMKSVKNSNGKTMASTFQFMYHTLTGELVSHCLPVEKGWEGRIIMFPNALLHQVYPFKTSDDYRISISGNLY